MQKPGLVGTDADIQRRACRNDVGGARLPGLTEPRHRPIRASRGGAAVVDAALPAVRCDGLAPHLRTRQTLRPATGVVLEIPDRGGHPRQACIGQAARGHCGTDGGTRTWKQQQQRWQQQGEQHLAQPLSCRGRHEQPAVLALATAL